MLLGLMLLAAASTSAQGLPPDRRSDWHKAGIATPAPTLLREHNVQAYGAIPNDTLPDAAAIQLALAALDGKAGLVHLPPGMYLIDQPLDLPSGAILRGAGADSTELVVDFGGADLDVIRIGSSTIGPDWYLTHIPAKGDQAIRLTGTSASAAGLQPGDWIEIVQDNGTWDEAPAGWAAESVGHISRIRAVAGDSLLLDDACRIAFNAADQPRLRRISPVNACGVECLRITRTDAAGDGAMIWFYLAVNSWVRGVASYRSAGAHVLASRSAHLDISGNYFHEAWLYDGVKTHGYGVTLVRHSSACLVQDNVFRELRHAMMVKQGANGNVFAYNYSTDPRRSEPVPDFSGDISLHGHYPFANLFEGNTVQNIFTDNYWGPSGPGNSFYRNRVELYGIVMTSPATLGQHYGGNDLTGAAPYYGNMLLSGSGHLSSGNLVRGMAEPPGTALSGSSSWYLSAAPAWWDSPDAWPSSGFGSSGKLPAQHRFETMAHPVACRTARCSAPGYLASDTSGSGAVTLSWGNVAGAARYAWRGRPGSSGPYLYRNPVSPDLTLSAGLEAGLTYTWQVRARCLNGYSAAGATEGDWREGPPSAWASFHVPLVSTAATFPSITKQASSLSGDNPLTLQVYPNPVAATGNFSIRCTGSWTLANEQGQVLQEGLGPAQLRAADYGPGVYVVRAGLISRMLLLLP